MVCSLSLGRKQGAIAADHGIFPEAVGDEKRALRLQRPFLAYMVVIGGFEPPTSAL